MPPTPRNQIEELTLANFRAFGRKQRIPLRPITLLYGQNSAGKSSILKAIQWMSKLRAGTGTDMHEKFVHNQNPDGEIEIGLTISLVKNRRGSCPASSFLDEVVGDLQEIGICGKFSKVGAPCEVTHSVNGISLLHSVGSQGKRASLAHSGVCPQDAPKLSVDYGNLEHPMLPRLLVCAKNAAITQIEENIELWKSQIREPWVQEMESSLVRIQDSLQLLRDFDTATIDLGSISQLRLPGTRDWAAYRSFCTSGIRSVFAAGKVARRGQKACFIISSGSGILRISL